VKPVAGGESAVEIERIVMMKRLAVAIAVLVLGAAMAMAEPMKGKVTAIEGKKVQIELTGEKAAWLKKGAPVKFKGGVGRVLEIKDAALTINSKSASKLTVGDEIELDKGPATLQGC
jgi:preprotein translocase subunit YajC